jgi:hypothetical protein
LLLTGARRAAASVAVLASVVWAALLEASANKASTTEFVVAALGVSACGALASITRYPKATAEQKRVLRWLAAGLVLSTGCVAVCLALHLMTDAPSPLGVWLAAGLLSVPVAQVLAVVVSGRACAGDQRDRTGCPGGRCLPDHRRRHQRLTSRTRA